jgi:uncharacterized phage-associated protein
MTRELSIARYHVYEQLFGRTRRFGHRKRATMAVSAHDVAREIRLRKPDVGTLKLQKLLYYCQGWYLAWTGNALFGEKIEAWANGPVVADLWHAENKGRPTPAARQLDPRANEIVDYVLARYGSLSGSELKQLTHTEAPWLDASETDAYNPEISPFALTRFFTRTDGMPLEREMVERLRSNTDIYSLVPTALSPRRRAAVERAKTRAAPEQLGG